MAPADRGLKPVNGGQFRPRQPPRPTIEPSQEALKCSLVGRLAQYQSPPQLAMLGQPNLGLAQGSVFVAYKAEDGQKLRLGKDVLGELGAIVVGQDGLGDLQSYPSQPNKPDLSDMLTVLDP